MITESTKDVAGTERRYPNIVGRGVVSTLGHSPSDCFNNLMSGDSGLVEIPAEFSKQFKAKNFYEIPGGMASRAPLRASEMVIEAIRRAVSDSELDLDIRCTPIIIGTGLGESRTAELRWLSQDEGNDELDNLSKSIQREFDAHDVSTISNACAASLYALAMAFDAITQGTAETIIVAGVDTITTSMFGLLDRVHPTAPECVRPFDENRQGVLMGEGAAAIVLSCNGRGIAHVKSVAINCDASHVTAPDAASIAQCMRTAHESAGTRSEAIDLIVAHGTGTILNDTAEATAMAQVWTSGTCPQVTALKGATGHTSGGSGLFSLIIAVECLTRGTVPPILGLEKPEASAAGLKLATQSSVLKGRHATAQVNAFGFGGLNAVALVSLNVREDR